MIHSGLAALKRWDREEYAAGYRARFSEIPDSETAHRCWRCGWEDADTEALESVRHKKVLAEGREDHSKIPGETCTTPGKMREQTASHSIRNGLSPGKRVGLPWTFGSACLRNRSTMRKGTQRALHCRADGRPCWRMAYVRPVTPSKGRNRSTLEVCGKPFWSGMLS